MRLAAQPKCTGGGQKNSGAAGALVRAQPAAPAAPDLAERHGAVGVASRERAVVAVVGQERRFVGERERDRAQIRRRAPRRPARRRGGRRAAARGVRVVARGRRAAGRSGRVLSRPARRRAVRARACRRRPATTTPRAAGSAARVGAAAAADAAEARAPRDAGALLLRGRRGDRDFARPRGDLALPRSDARAMCVGGRKRAHSGATVSHGRTVVWFTGAGPP